MDFDSFNDEVRSFLINLIDKSSDNYTLNSFFKETYNINDSKLIEILLDRGVVQQIDDNEFVVPRNGYERKLKRLYVLMSGRTPKPSPIVEDEGVGGDMGGATSASAVNNSAPIGKLSFIKK